MAERCSYDYAIVRVVPRVERGERINAGVILFCPERAFLDARVELDEPRLLALMPGLSEAELEEIRGHLLDIEHIARGEPGAGPIGELPQAQRFHWLSAPRSTVVQPSPVHAGLTSDPTAALDTLFATLVRLPSSLQGE